MDKISPIKARILHFIENQNITKVDFCNKTGISYANLKGKSLYSEIGGDKIAEILSIYPIISAEWLVSGVGDMLKGEMSSILNESVEGYGKPSDDIHKIPIIDIEAAAGEGRLNGDYIEPIGYITVPSNSLHSRTATYYGIRSRGDSMFPTIYDKDILIIRQLDRGEWAELRDEYVYVVVNSDGKAFVKRIKNRLSRGFVVLTSDNLDKVNYPNFTLEENELHYFFYAELKISAHFPNINATYFDRLKLLEDRVDEIDFKFKRLDK